jgi:betaine-aldehyde dehydrogenase
MQQRDKLFINGKWVSPRGTGLIDVIHSTTEAVMGRIPEGSARDAEDAIQAARAAFDGWASTPPAVRADYIRKIAEGLKARTEELAQLIAGEVGMPIKLARAIQVGGPVYNWGQAAKLLEGFDFEEEVGNSLVVREPVGVVAAITP